MNSAKTIAIMHSTRISGCALAFIVSVALLFALPVSGQMSPTGNNGTQLGHRIPPSRQIDQSDIDAMAGTPMTGTPIFYEKRLQILNAAQHQSMVSDTDRLLKLVADLNSQINNSKTSTLTPEQLRMVADIEKLAHSVKDKMRMSVRSAVNNYVGAPFPSR